ncbi:DUF2510 domain-containing protein [Streptomyces sp. NPDC048523]|uniref:DUF2510 domain-containing protein n=1 Tax=Streptomyces sp. NPDC048523 TaxID=3365567 RepID=UPI00371AF75A
MSRTLPPGWYPDPDAPQLERWWDGTAWTDHRRVPGAPARRDRRRGLRPRPGPGRRRGGGHGTDRHEPVAHHGLRGPVPPGRRTWDDVVMRWWVKTARGSGGGCCSPGSAHKAALARSCRRPGVEYAGDQLAQDRSGRAAERTRSRSVHRNGYVQSLALTPAPGLDRITHGIRSVRR